MFLGEGAPEPRRAVCSACWGGPWQAWSGARVNSDLWECNLGSGQGRVGPAIESPPVRMAQTLERGWQQGEEGAPCILPRV